jgi:hypothetical protein
VEDFLVMRGYKYCRIDGNTTYEDREASIDDFNAENSEKFIFILSTRAGKLSRQRIHQQLEVGTDPPRSIFQVDLVSIYKQRTHVSCTIVIGTRSRTFKHKTDVTVWDRRGPYRSSAWYQKIQSKKRLSNALNKN